MADQHDIQHSIIELQAKKSRLGIKKQTEQAEINKFREMLKYITQGHETFEELVKKKNAHIANCQEIDLELSEIKRELKKRQQLKIEVMANEQPKNVPLNTELVLLRDRYLSFAGDKTRVASMRAMAADFASDLTKLIKKHG